MSELLDCPFCGCAMRVHSNRDWHYAVGQHDDGCLLVDSDFRFPANDAMRADLVDTWNRRDTDGQRAGVPKGWKLVPVEPEPKQLEAIKAAYRSARRGGIGGQSMDGTFRREWAPELQAYAAAIAAAPTPPAGDAGQESDDYDCHRCRDELTARGVLPMPRMILCPICGNKRCPKANDHRNACTGSNEPGQPGSAYPDIAASKGEKG